jgi:hypothetical protein
MHKIVLLSFHDTRTAAASIGREHQKIKQLLLAATVVSIMKSNHLFFVFSCSYSTLLPGAERPDTLYGQQAQTGLWLTPLKVWRRPSWDSHPSGDLPEPPSLRVPASAGL